MVSREQQIKALQAMQDRDIDTSEDNELSDESWAEAERGKFFRPRKVQKTVRIDADVIRWLESKGPGYQTRLNMILRAAMLGEQKA